MRAQTVCFTGHRKIPLEQYAPLHQRLEGVVIDLIDRGYCFFFFFGAMGFDTMAAQVVLTLRQWHPQLRLFLALPCLHQAKYWPEADQAVYEHIQAQADQVVYLGQNYTRGCMYRRNRYLVDCSSVCVCYLTEATGGTAYTVKYARQQGLQIISLV